MNVLILSELFPNSGRPHSGTFVAEQARALSESARVTAIAPIPVPLPTKRFREERRRRLEIPRYGLTHGVETYYPRYLDFPRFSEAINAYAMAAATLQCVLVNRVPIDVIHTHCAYYAGFVGCLLGRILRKPVVVTVHGFDVNLYLKALPGYEGVYGVSEKHVSKIRGHRALWALQRCARVIAVSDELRERVVGLGISPEKVVTIRNGVDVERFRPMDQREARGRLGLPVEARIMLFVGNLGLRKDPESLILAFERVRQSYHQDAVLVIIGQGVLREPLERLVDEKKLRSMVRFVGAVPYEMVPVWMNACDIFVLPSLYESFGCVLLEALACGKPIVTIQAGAIPEVFRNGQHGRLVEPRQPEGLARAIPDVLGRKWEQERLAGFAREHTWQAVARQIYGCYQEVVGGT